MLWTKKRQGWSDSRLELFILYYYIYQNDTFFKNKNIIYNNKKKIYIYIKKLKTGLCVIFNLKTPQDQ